MFNEKNMNIIYRVLEEKGLTLLINEVGLVVADLDDVSPDAYELWGKNSEDILTLLPYQVDSDLEFSVDELKQMNALAYDFAIEQGQDLLREDMLVGVHPFLKLLNKGLNDIANKSNFTYKVEMNTDMDVKVELLSFPNEVNIRLKLYPISEVTEDEMVEWRVQNRLTFDLENSPYVNLFISHLESSDHTLEKATETFVEVLKDSVENSLNKLFSESKVEDYLNANGIKFNKYGSIVLE